MPTTIVSVDPVQVGTLSSNNNTTDLLDEIRINFNETTPDAEHLRKAAEELRTSHTPVAFPTETVYGLGADATRSEAVKGIFAAKQRPSDNPLIVHFASLQQLRSILKPSTIQHSSTNGHAHPDPIPAIYHPLIRRFWPGPLTIILPTPSEHRLAPEVTAGLDTFGARIPRHPIALALISLAGVPIAAPSANASTKPSPTTAEHVASDLDGRIHTIIDGGPCAVGVESTVVDGLSDPPSILRPGGISVEQLRSCPGWESVVVAYHDAAEKGSKPRAPGMKYRHYSPRAPVILYEGGRATPSWETLRQHSAKSHSVGLIRTRTWRVEQQHLPELISTSNQSGTSVHDTSLTSDQSMPGFKGMLRTMQAQVRQAVIQQLVIGYKGETLTIHDIELGKGAEDIARGIFGALRSLDTQDVDTIFVEGIADDTDDLAAAVMNRLRKAAEKTM